MAQAEHLQQKADKRAALLQGDPAAAKRQHEQGKLTARERVEMLLDGGSFVELESLREGSGVITGYGLVGERPVYVIAQDILVKGAAMSSAQADKMEKLLSLAQKTGAPILFFADSQGMNVREGAPAMAGYSRVLSKFAKLSGVCPLICVVAGPCMGIAAHFALLSDLAIAVEKTALMMPVSPLVLNAAMGESYQEQEMGGAEILAKQGSVSLTAENEQAAIALCKRLIGLLPSSNAEYAPLQEGDDLNRLLSADASDGLALAMDLADQGTALELYAGYGKGCHTFLARVGGYTVGIVAGEPKEEGGRLNADACRKAARLVQLCDCFDLPIISLLMSEGMVVPCLMGQGKQMAASARLLYAYAEAQVPKLAVFCGNAIGPAYVAMGGKELADVAYAWPEAMLAPLTREAAVQTFKADQLATEDRAKLESAFADSADGYLIAGLGLCDEVIEPAQTRKHLIAALELLVAKKQDDPERRHGNLPL